MSKPLISLSATALFLAVSAEALASAPLVSRPDCAAAASIRAEQTFLRDSGWTQAAVDQFTTVQQPAYFSGDSANVLTVSITTKNPAAWNGYATYKVQVEAAEASVCQAVNAQLDSSQGLIY